MSNISPNNSKCPECGTGESRRWHDDGAGFFMQDRYYVCDVCFGTRGQHAPIAAEAHDEDTVPYYTKEELDLLASECFLEDW